MIQVRRLPLGPLQTNCYMLGCEETNLAAIIDPAFDAKAIYTMADQDSWQISLILLTHAHFDHVGGLNDLRTLSGAPVYAHKDALDSLGNTNLSAAFFGIDHPQYSSDSFLVDNQILRIGNINLRVLYTPGHAIGHVCFYAEEYGLLFGGDVLFRGGIGRTDLDGGNYEALMESIQSKLLTLPDETRLFPGHGPETTIGEERLRNPFLQDLDKS